MDSRPFDALTRALANSRTRRDTLRDLAAFVGAGRLLQTAGLAQANDDKHGRSTDADAGGHDGHDRRHRGGVDPQIAGGTPVPPGKYPFAASLRMHGVAGDFLCSGSLIDASHVLTAAHCTFDDDAGAPFPLSAYAVLVGQVDRTSTSCAACRKHVTGVAVDPAWTGAGLETIRPHDVAVLTLDAPVAASTAKPIELVGSGGDGLDGAGQSVIAAGWGITTTGGDASNALMEAPLNVLAAAVCLPDPTWLCTQVVGGRATCSGDSGGPLFVAAGSTASRRSLRLDVRRETTTRRRHHHQHHHHHHPPVSCGDGTFCPPGDTCCPPSEDFPNGSCAGVLNAVCCDTDGYCNPGSACCPPSGEFPDGSCAPAGTSCGGGGGGSSFTQIGAVSGGPAGCPSANGSADVYIRLSNPAINAFIRNALAGGAPECTSCPAGDTCCPPTAQSPGGTCAPEVNAVCCPANATFPNGGYCPAGDTCCPPDAQFPGGSCAPAGVTCAQAANRTGATRHGDHSGELTAARPLRKHADANASTRGRRSRGPAG